MQEHLEDFYRRYPWTRPPFDPFAEFFIFDGNECEWQPQPNGECGPCQYAQAEADWVEMHHDAFTTRHAARFASKLMWEDIENSRWLRCQWRKVLGRWLADKLWDSKLHCNMGMIWQQQT